MILVTGGTGLLGSHLLYALVREKRPVRALFRNSGRHSLVRKVFSYYNSEPGELFDRIEWVEGDLLDQGAMEDAMEGVDEVYHAGAVVSFYPADHAMMRRVNIGGTAQLVNLSLEYGVKKFCYVSSVAALGRAANDGESDEETHWVESKKNSVYSQTKHAAEQEVWRGMAEGLPAVIVNPAVILGPGYWQDNSGLFRLVYEGLKYYTLGVNGYVDVRDLPEAMMLLMEREAFGERFILSSENCSYQQIFSQMARYLGKPAPSVRVPPSLTGIAWRVEAVRSFFTGRKPEITREMATTTSQVYTYTHQKIRDRFGFQFMPVEQSIRETCAHYLADLTPETGSGSDNNGE